MNMKDAHSLILNAALVALDTNEVVNQTTHETRTNYSVTVSCVLPGARRPQQITITVDEVDSEIVEKAARGDFMYKPCKISIYGLAARPGFYTGAAPSLSISGTLLEIDGKSLDAFMKPTSQPVPAKA